MTASIFEVLSELRASALDERDKGDKFERLIQAYLKTDPEWASRFSDVWMWSEWPSRAGRPDTGIDLVAQNADGNGLTAIQCKFYAADHKVAKADIDSFVSASAREEFTRRIVFDTAAGWSGNAEETLRGVAQRVDIGYLDTESAIDWGQFSWATPEVVVPTGRKALRPHQQKALADVRAGFATHDRGKLIMACGTGKTFTSLRIAEDLVGEGGNVLFLVPSIQLLSQSLREWMANAEVDLRPFAVCSDVRVGRRVATDDADQSTIDLTEPASTDPDTLVARFASGRHATPRMSVVFATYQSIEVIVQAQKSGLPDFDLVICDEAHRTTGVTLAGRDESAFVRVHDNTALHAAKRLYMTATPRVFGDDVRKKAAEADAVIADMGDEDTYGPELHRLGFGDAVEAGLLTDYKVLVLAVDEEYVAKNFQQAMAVAGEIKLDDAAKLIGCWNGLAKHFGPAAELAEGSDATGGISRAPMRTAVAFAQNIASSKTAASAFPELVDRVLVDVAEHNADRDTADTASAGGEGGDGGKDVRTPLRVEAAHVDGTMGIHERNTHLAWLKQDTSDTNPPVCRVLTNAKCLSEGVDVPALDAVLFLTPRSSQVDVVQSVGRVMRKAPGKELGYIILPVVVPSFSTPEKTLADNDRFKVVWQVLQALRSHDDRFHALVNQIELNKKRPDRIEVHTVTGDDGSTDSREDRAAAEVEAEEQAAKERVGKSVQAMLDYPTDAFTDAMYARIVTKVGERKYWETWARDVAQIAQNHITRIKALLADPDSNPAREFEVFLSGLRGNLNENITADEAIEMLAQHLVTRPIFEALFAADTTAGDTPAGMGGATYDFAATNPVAKTMELMLASLDEHNLEAENETLEKFYASVRRRVEGVDNAEGKQRILVELYDKFFAVAFKKTVDKLGIVYTPIEIVDFILRSADAVLRQEFDQGLTDEGVHILDGFTGTGTFLVRLLQSGLIEPHDLARKYAQELHGNEILLLAYYIAAVNIEQTYAELIAEAEPGRPAEPFPGLILTDTFQSWEPDDRPDLNVFPENNARLEHLKSLPITVIVGNPPYSSGQDSANDNNANEKYPALDEEIRRTYADESRSASVRSMYDSYIRAIKWATLRIKVRGVIAYVTNGGFLDSNSADGMRKALADEFSAIHIYNLRGNQRTAGEQSRKEGGKVFGGGSRATVAITILVKNPTHTGPATIHYTDIGEYLTREEKLAKVAAADTALTLPSTAVTANEHGDWLNQRRDDFGQFEPVNGIFDLTTNGVVTSRDAWVYSFKAEQLLHNVTTLVGAYTEGLGGTQVRDAARISWSRSLENRHKRGAKAPVVADASVQPAQYRPFCQRLLYFDPWLNEVQYQTRQVFPTPKHENRGFVLPGPSSHSEFCVLMTDRVPDLHLIDTGSLFARFRYEVVDDRETFDFSVGGEVIDGYRRTDNITDDALARFANAYPSETVTKDDIFFYVYGLLHSQTYRDTYAADLKKSLPRIPFVRDFRGFGDAGRALSELHLGYESVEPYPLGGLDAAPPAGGDVYSFFSVGEKKMRFGKPTAEQKAAGEKRDRSVIHYNDWITLSGIPEEAYRYMLGSRSAIEWIIDRYYIKTDKASGIVNDPNDWSREVGDPRYILDLLARIVTVSLETMAIVDNLPELDIIEGI